MKEINFYNKESKKQEIETMFDNIANNYDILNSLFSMRIHKWWKKKFIQEIQIKNPKYILDVATGTGDIAIEYSKYTNAKIIGCDISKKMIEIGKNKINKLNLKHRINIINADVECIPFSENTFDVITVAFGIRNFQNLKKSLSEILRVLKKNGELHILEFSKPEGFFYPFLFFYIHYILPKIGKLISKNLYAYSYLSNSIKSFPSGEKLKLILEQTGYHSIKYKKLTFGIVTLYQGIK